jgi:hypothetical protein
MAGMSDSYAAVFAKYTDRQCGLDRNSFYNLVRSEGVTKFHAMALFAIYSTAACKNVFK